MDDYRAQTDALAHRIAVELDKPSVYMGGSSAASKRKAEAIVSLLPDYRGAVDPMRESRIARATGLAQAIAECRDDARLDGIREGAAEIVTLLGGR
jgi:hypothetical protein